MKKKTKIAILSSLVSLSLLVLPVTSLVNGFFLPAVFGDTFLGELKEKVKMLKNTEGKRMVFIGGSALPFGLDSALIASQFPGYGIVDFGMYASLGSNVMLDLSLENIHSEDIVVFCPEIDSQTLSMYYNGESLWQALDGDFGSLSLLESSTRERLFGDFYHFSQQKFKYTFQEKIELSGIYQKSSFDEYGDIKKELRPYNTMLGMADGTKTISFDTAMISDEFLSYVNDYASEVRKKGASIYFGFVPMNRAGVANEDDIDGFYDYLNEKLDFEILGNPHDSIMDKEWFFDTDFHLNGPGTTVYTRNMIQNLKLVLDDRSKTEIPLPEKPIAPRQPEDDRDGDNRDADCFSYYLTDQGYFITSLLTERKNIVVPYRHDGTLVIGFSKDCFASKTEIEEITIQPNIKRIFDDSFNGCASLKKIRLLNPMPSSIAIGAGLLNGTDADLYIPSEFVGSYITNYKFSQYSSRIKADE